MDQAATKLWLASFGAFTNVCCSMYAFTTGHTSVMLDLPATACSIAPRATFDSKPMLRGKPAKSVALVSRCCSLVSSLRAQVTAAQRLPLRQLGGGPPRLCTSRGDCGAQRAEPERGGGANSRSVIMVRVGMSLITLVYFLIA